MDSLQGLLLLDLRADDPFVVPSLDRSLQLALLKILLLALIMKISLHLISFAHSYVILIILGLLSRIHAL